MKQLKMCIALMLVLLCECFGFLSVDSGFSLPSYLCDNSKTEELKNTAYNDTIFVHGIVTGTLDPDYYGSYYVQDAWWLLGVGKIWGEVAASTNITSLKAFAARKERSWTTFGEAMFRNFSIAYQVKCENVAPGKAAQSYIEYIRSSIKVEPANVLVSTYPCLKLWDFWQTTCYKTGQRTGNVYFNAWCFDSSTEGPSDEEKLMQTYFDEGILKNKEELLNLFWEGMGHEIAFFNGAGVNSLRIPVSLSGVPLARDN